MIKVIFRSDQQKNIMKIRQTDFTYKFKIFDVIFLQIKKRYFKRQGKYSVFYKNIM